MFISLFLCRFKVCECQTRSCKTGAGVSEHSPLIQTAVNVLLMLWTYCCVIWKMYITHPPCFVRIIHTIVIAVHLLMLMLCLKFVPQKNCALLAMLWISMSTGVQSEQIVQISALSDDDAGTAVHLGICASANKHFTADGFALSSVCCYCCCCCCGNSRLLTLQARLNSVHSMYYIQRPTSNY